LLNCPLLLSNAAVVVLFRLSAFAAFADFVTQVKLSGGIETQRSSQ